MKINKILHINICFKYYPKKNYKINNNTTSITYV